MYIFTKIKSENIYYYFFNINTYNFVYCFLQRGKDLFRPTEAWKPADKSLRELRSNSVTTTEPIQEGQYDNPGFVMP